MAVEDVTCLVLAPGAPSAFAGRGAQAQLFEASTAIIEEQARSALVHVDVSGYVGQKIAAVAAHRTQYPIAPDMLPLPLLQELFGQEYFVQVHPSLAPEMRQWLGTLTQGKATRRVTGALPRSKLPQPASLA